MHFPARLRLVTIPFAAGLLAACSGNGAGNTTQSQADQAQAKLSEEQGGAANNAGAQLSFNARKAHFDYQMNCQGCHGPTGTGSVEREVPTLDNVDRFLKLPEGREFLIRVPGMSRSPLSNADLTNLANWMMEEFGGSDGTLPHQPFEEAEVARLRDNPIVDGVVEHRARLVARLDAVPSS